MVTLVIQVLSPILQVSPILQAPVASDYCILQIELYEMNYEKLFTLPLMFSDQQLYTYLTKGGKLGH